VPDTDGPTVQILFSSHAPYPRIRKLDGPPRLVIDLRNADLSLQPKRYPFQSDLISAVRIHQYHKGSLVTRVVVDLLKPTAYTWDTVGNQLMVRLHAAAAAPPAEPVSLPGFSLGAQPAAVPVSPGSSGAIVFAGGRLSAAGSSLTAGVDTAILHLARGGEVRVCPGTTVSVTSSQNGNELMLGMSTGALEAHYALDASSDSVLTPDFRIVLAGPGELHYAVSADSRGNTCIRALPGNTASVIVSEMMGEGTYRVKPTEEVVFHSGRLNLPDTAVPRGCGCPPPAIPVMRASAPSMPVISDADLPASVRLAQPGDAVKPVPPPVSVSGLQSGAPPTSRLTLPVAPTKTASLPESQPSEIHIQVDAPLIFRASDPQAPQPASTGKVERLPVAGSSRPAPLLSTVPPPPEAQPKLKQHGFFRKIKNFFGGVFR
ncbi:MAG TPA: AMIN domain-containing protein, partial [Bryobacteraceae bacterium]|nr:AMIN domain-containing protein [Bryobacteraceae bacterium]